MPWPLHSLLACSMTPRQHLCLNSWPAPCLLLCVLSSQTMGAHQWADEELTLFYQHYHNTTKEWDKVRKHGST